jgi:hypothetical protein
VYRLHSPNLDYSSWRDVTLLVSVAAGLRYWLLNTVTPGYNDNGLYDASSIVSDILLYQLILTVNRKFTHLA